MHASGRDDTVLANAILNRVAMVVSYAATWSGREIRHLREEDIDVAMNNMTLSIVGDDSTASVPAYWPCRT